MVLILNEGDTKDDGGIVLPHGYILLLALDPRQEPKSKANLLWDVVLA